MTLTDPAPVIPYGTTHPRQAWYDQELRPRLPAYQEEKKGKGGKGHEALRARLEAQDWGTEASPGDSFWALRALASKVSSPSLLALLGDFLGTQADPLPGFLADLWSSTYYRQVALETLVSQPAAPLSEKEQERQLGLRQQALEQLLRHWPQIASWTCQDPEKVMLPPAQWADPQRKPAIWNLLLAKMLPYPNQRNALNVWPGAVEQILATQPLAGMDPQVRQDTYGGLVLRYPDLRTHVQPDDITAPLQVMNYQTQRVLGVAECVRRRDLEGFDRLVALEGITPDFRDIYGQTLFQMSVSALQTRREVTAGYQPQYGAFVPAVWDWETSTRIEQAFTTLLAFWERFAALKVPFDATCQPLTPPRMSKITGKPVRTEKWPRQAALPSETVTDQVQRLIEEELLPSHSVVVLRQWTLLQHPAPSVPPPARRSRPRA